MVKKKLCAVIMCGGSGTRFWPASRRQKPKQFLRLNNKISLIEQTVARLGGIIPPERIYLLAAEGHENMLKRFVPDIPAENYILEPEARNTGPALALAAKRLEEKGSDLVMAALPADHAIRDTKGFGEALEIAANFAAKSENIVTIGITPDLPETGYGYIELGEDLGNGVRSVIKFVEKPPMEKALEYLNAGRFVWNAGMFIVKVQTLVNEFRENEPGIYKPLWEKVPAYGDAGYDRNLRDIYPDLPKVSVDYAVMEKAENVACLPAKFDWNDLGSWSALEKYWGQDKQGNAAGTRYYSLDSTGNIIAGAGRDIALIGVQDLIIVEREDVVLVCAKERSQDVKDLLELLKKEERDDLL